MWWAKSYLARYRRWFILAGIIIIFSIFWLMHTGSESLAKSFIDDLARQNYASAYTMVDITEGFIIDKGNGYNEIFRDKENIFMYFSEMNKEILSQIKPLKYIEQESLVIVCNANGKPMYHLSVKKVNDNWRISKIRRIIY